MYALPQKDFIAARDDVRSLHPAGNGNEAYRSRPIRHLPFAQIRMLIAETAGGDT